MHIRRDTVDVMRHEKLYIYIYILRIAHARHVPDRLELTVSFETLFRVSLALRASGIRV